MEGDDMNIDPKSVLENYGERMARLAIYHPLIRLSRKKKKDKGGKEIDFYGLGMVALLFFFENMIMRHKTSGVKELAIFLESVTRDYMDLDPQGFEELAREIIDVFRPSGGKRNGLTFFNWETKQEETTYYTILKAGKSDLKLGTQYYTLDEAGLELIFATKEYFSEFQISINQLLLRKQLEKGEFVGALRQIDEMNLSVETLRERMTKIKHEVSRNIVSEETYERYKRLIEDINLRLLRENEEFDELQEFVRATKDHVKYHIENDKDKKAYDLILKIDYRLDEVHHEHRQLLQESILLKTEALSSAQQALYFIGIDSFNFQQDIASHLLSKPLPLVASRVLINPFLLIENKKQWSPMSVFQKQRIEKDGDKIRSKNFLNALSEEELYKQKEIIRCNFKTLAAYTLEAMQSSKSITLEALCTFMEAHHRELLHNRLFYDFWIILHQKSPVDLNDMDEKSLLKGLKDVIGGRANYLKVTEYEGEIRLVQRFTIKNMMISLEETADGV